VGLRGKLMRFLFRMTFWLGIVLLLLPGGGTHTSSNSSVSAGDAMSAARATVDDARAFCDRQREACAVGSQVAASVGQRASAGAKMLYEFLSERFGKTEAAADANAGGLRSVQPVMRSSRDTLVPTDLVAAWRGMGPRREAPHLDRPQ
jgi:hypothetical protein